MKGVTRVGLSGGIEVGIYKLDEIFKEVRELGIDNEVLKEELLTRVKRHNWVPESKEAEFATAIFEAYKTFCNTSA